jgi:hypothetical protein
MKKLFVIAMLVMAINKTQAQDTITYYQMNKVQLAQIYLTEVNRVTKKMPTIAFDSTMADVPKSKYLGAKFKKVATKIADYQKTLLAEYAEIIPYADKKNLIEAIIYLRGL